MHDTATGNERRFSNKAFGIWSGKAERNRRLQSDQKIGDVAAFKENVCLLEDKLKFLKSRCRHLVRFGASILGSDIDHIISVTKVLD